ncbi:MAG: hypothetical protein HY043_15300, partial [Verrucomicrobia bacterium]|nr:hypothetical protein [Verrucomicrobiota bacterium]
ARSLSIATIVPDGSDLWIGGAFDRIDNLTVNNVARWDGTQWHALGTGVGTGPNASVTGLDVSTDRVYLTGTFTTAGSKGSRYFAIWHKSSTPTEIIVNSTSDLPQDPAVTCCCDTGKKLADGVTPECTLRAAIQVANKRPGKDNIKFAIPSADPNFHSGVPRIQPQTGLPDITDPISIDGWSQNQNAMTPPVELSGKALPRYFVGYENGQGDKPLFRDQYKTSGLVLAGGNSEVRGLVINYFPFAALDLKKGNNLIQGNFIGMDATGTISQGNSFFWNYGTDAQVLVESGGNQIGGVGARAGNVISTGAGWIFNYPEHPDYVFKYRATGGALGIDLSGPDNVVEGNIIGLRPDGTSRFQALPDDPAVDGDGGPTRGSVGIVISQGGTNSRIGGSAPGTGNVISEFGLAIYLLVGGCQIEGNRIGTDITGTTAFPNLIGVLVDVHRGNVIGGSNPTAGNVISGNGVGILVKAADTPVIQGNDIGVQADGVTPLSNGVGVWLAYSGFNGRGGPQVLANVIAFNARCGVVVGGDIALGEYPSDLNVIQGNWIHDNGKGQDVLDLLTSQGARLGDIFNVFAVRDGFAGDGAGIYVLGGASNRITGNMIYGNRGLGISLKGATQPPAGAASSPVLNDFDDFDHGSNERQNFPVIRSAEGPLGTVTLEGFLRTKPSSQPYLIEIFASQAAHPSGYGEGETFLGSFSALVGFGGSATFTQDFALPPKPLFWITATATDEFGNTSEFSPAILMQGLTRTFPNKGISDAVQQQVPGGNGSLHSVSAGSRGNLQLQGGAGGLSVGGAGDTPAPLGDPPSGTTAASKRSGESPERTGQWPVLPQSVAAATGDGNGDGIQDYLQANVVSFPGISGKWITLASPANTALENVVPSGPPDFTNLPTGYTFPLGFVNFSVTGLATGSSVTVTNFFHDDIDYDTVFAYGLTPDNPSPHWYEFIFDGGAGAQLELNGFTLTFIDGDVGDHDLKADGRITTTLAAAHKIPPGPQLSLLSTTLGTAPRLQFTTAPGGGFMLTTNQVPIVTSVLAWPTGASGYALQFTDNLSPTNFWQTDFTTPAVLNNQNVITNVTANTARFYRLRKF